MTDRIAQLLNMLSQGEIVALLKKSDLALGTEAVATRLGVSVRCLEDWRKRHVGPKWKKYGKRIVYRVHDVEAYLDQGDPSPTPDSSP